MPKKRTDLGNFNKIIDDYLDKIEIPTKQGLRIKLGINSDFITDCRRRDTKWQKEFIKKWDYACEVMLNIHLNATLIKPEIRWNYISRCFSKELDKDNDIDNNNNNITINIPNVRVVTHDE